MKILLNITIYCIIILIWSDIERNSVTKSLDYTRTLYCLLGLIPVGFFRLYINDLNEHIKKLHGRFFKKYT